MRVRHAVALATTLPLIVLGGVVPAPAGAQLGNGTCDVGEICIWEHSNFRGCFGDIAPGSLDADWGDGQPDWNTCGGVTEDKVSSFWNRSDAGVVFYSRNSYLGNAVCVWPGGKEKSLQGKLNDVFSSHNDELPEDQTYPTPPHPRAPSFPQGPDGCDQKNFG